METYSSFSTKYPIEQFGFSPRECELILAVLNYLPAESGFIPTAEALASEIAAEAEIAFADRQKFGQQSRFLPDETTDLPVEMREAAGKFLALEPWQAVAVWFFVIGYWAGITEAVG